MKDEDAGALPPWWGPRASLSDPPVAEVIARVGEGADVSDIGGWVNLNALVATRPPHVLRVYRPWMKRPRVLAIRRLRERLAADGCPVPLPLMPGDSLPEVFRAGDRWAELESFLPHSRPSIDWAGYLRSFEEMGKLHRALGPAWDPATPAGVDNYGSPNLSWRLLRITERLFGLGFSDTAARVRTLLREVSGARAVAAELPHQAVHGDFRIGNAVETQAGSWAYLDFDYANFHERVFDPAYSAYFAAINLGWTTQPEVPWNSLDELLRAYESTAPAPLTTGERRHVPTVIAQVGLYFAAAAGFGNSAGSALEDVGIAEWVWRDRREYTG